MNPEMIADGSVAQPEGLLPWHRPEIRELSITLDTGIGGGSNVDLNVEDPGFMVRSDIRLKKDISGIQNAMDGVRALSGVTYLYDAAKYPELRLATRPQIGFIAQELEQVYPELVTTKENGFKAVNYAQLVPVLVEALKEQQAMLEDLQARVTELRERSAVGTL
jgi:hypothetical protein